MDLSYNKLTNFNCTFNQIKNLELNLPEFLKTFDCRFNQIKNLELNLPENLQEFYCSYNQIQFVDNVSLEEYQRLFGKFDLNIYKLLKKL